MTKPRVLIPVATQFSVRYLLRTGLLNSMRQFAQPVVLMSWSDQELWQEMETAGAEVHALPIPEMDNRYDRVRREIDFLHFRRLQSQSTAINRRRVSQNWSLGLHLHYRVRDTFYRLKHSIPGVTQGLLQQEEKALWEYTNIYAIKPWFESLAPDAVLSLTPFLRDEQLILRLAKSAELPLMSAILSFDNITTRGWFPVRFDLYLLWNIHNARQLLRAYPEVFTSEIKVVGPPQFDFYWDESYIWPQSDWRRTLRLSGERPVILYAAGHPTHLPHEPQWVRVLDDAISEGQIVERPVILLRRHPNDTLTRWNSVLARAKNVVVDEPWPGGAQLISHTNIRRADIERLASTLAHCRVHINACSTMTVDGAIFDRPQVGPAYDDSVERSYDRMVKELYSLEHYLPITNSGGLHIAYDQRSYIRAVNEGLTSPGHRAGGRKQIVREICTFDDGFSTVRALAAIREYLGMHVDKGVSAKCRIGEEV